MNYNILDSGEGVAEGHPEARKLFNIFLKKLKVMEV